jgi:transposase
MRAYSLDLRERIVAAVEDGHSRSEVARLFGVSRRTVGRYVRQQAETADLRARPIPGRQRAIAAEQEAQLTAQLQAHSSATLEQHRQLWAETTGVRVSVATMFRAINRLGWTWKKKRWWPPSGMRRHGRPGATP